MKKAIYEDNGRYTHEARDITKEFSDMVKPFFNRLVDAGFNSRELSWLLMDEIAVEEICIRHRPQTRVIVHESKPDST